MCPSLSSRTLYVQPSPEPHGMIWSTQVCCSDSFAPSFEHLPCLCSFCQCSQLEALWTHCGPSLYWKYGIVLSLLHFAGSLLILKRHYYLCITCGYPLNQYLYSVYNVWSVNVEIWLPYSEIVSASVSVGRVYLYGLMVANNLVLREKRALLTTI